MMAHNMGERYIDTIIDIVHILSLMLNLGLFAVSFIH